MRHPARSGQIAGKGARGTGALFGLLGGRFFGSRGLRCSLLGRRCSRWCDCGDRLRLRLGGSFGGGLLGLFNPFGDEQPFVLAILPHMIKVAKNATTMKIKNFGGEKGTEFDEITADKDRSAHMFFWN